MGKAYILDNHDEEGKLDPQGLLGISRARDVVGRHVCAHDLEHRRLNVLVRDTLDVSIADCGVRIWHVRKPQGIGVRGREGGEGAHWAYEACVGKVRGDGSGRESRWGGGNLCLRGAEWAPLRAGRSERSRCTMRMQVCAGGKVV